MDNRTRVPGLGTDVVWVSTGGEDGVKDMVTGTDIEVVASADVAIGIGC